jgi:type I restriction enzyme S subunit
MKQLVMMPLSKLLFRHKDTINIQEIENYKRITIRMNNQGIIMRDCVLGSEIGTKKQFIAKSGQLVLSKIDARNSAFGILPKECDGAIITGNFWAFDVNYKLLDTKYFNYLTHTPLFVEFCIKASEGTTNRRYLDESKFLSMQIPLPPLDEQRRIVARIEELAAKVEEARGLRRQSIEEAEALKKSAMSQVFKPHDKYQEVPLESVCAAIIDNLHSNPVYADVGVPCVRSSDVGWGVLYLETARRTSEDEYKQRTVRGEPTPDDIVLVREGGGTGKVAIVQKGQRFSLGQRVMMLRPDKSVVLPKFCLYQFLSPSIYEDQILPHCKGSASPHLNIGKLRRFVFFLPPLLEQHRIVAYLDNLQAKVDALKRLQTETATELDALLPSILDKAFKGEL